MSIDTRDSYLIVPAETLQGAVEELISDRPDMRDRDLAPEWHPQMPGHVRLRVPYYFWMTPYTPRRFDRR